MDTTSDQSLTAAMALLCGYAADLALGDPGRWHPVAGFGRVALALERVLYAPTRLRGALFAAVLVAAPAIGAERLARSLPRWLVLAALDVGGARRALADARGAGRLRPGRAR